MPNGVRLAILHIFMAPKTEKRYTPVALRSVTPETLTASLEERLSALRSRLRLRGTLRPEPY